VRTYRKFSQCGGFFSRRLIFSPLISNDEKPMTFVFGNVWKEMIAINMRIHPLISQEEMSISKLHVRKLFLHP
jgi:hypothetical protein